MSDLQYFAGPSYEEGVSAVTATPSVGLGSRRNWKGEEYIYCFNAGSVSMNVGYGCRPVTAASGYSVSIASSAEVFNPLVGVVKHANIPASSYGWVMSRGFASVITASALTSNHMMLALGVDGKFGEASGTTTMGTATVIGHTLSCNTGAGGSVYAFIKGLS